MTSTMSHLGNAVTLKAFTSQEMTKQILGYKDTVKYGKKLWGGFNMSKRYNFSHEQLVEIHSGLKNGCWVNHEVRMELIKMLEDHFIELATSSQVKLIPKK